MLRGASIFEFCSRHAFALSFPFFELSMEVLLLQIFLIGGSKVIHFQSKFYSYFMAKLLLHAILNRGKVRNGPVQLEI